MTKRANHGDTIKCPDCGTDYIYSARNNDIHKCENHQKSDMLNNLDNLPFGTTVKLKGFQNVY